MTADDGGADKLGAPGLLVLPGVAHDREACSSGGQHGEQQVAADHRGAADARARRPGRRAAAPGCSRRARPRSASAWCGRARRSGQHRGHEDGEPEHIGGEREPVAPEREPGERDRAGERRSSRAAPARHGVADSRCPRRSGAGTAPRASAASWSASARRTSTRRSQDAVELAGVDAELAAWPSTLRSCTPGSVAQRADRLGRLDDDGRAGEVAQLVEGARSRRPGRRG